MRIYSNIMYNLSLHSECYRMLMHAEQLSSLCTLHQLKHPSCHFSPGPKVLSFLVILHSFAGQNDGDRVLTQEVPH